MSALLGLGLGRSREARVDAEKRAAKGLSAPTANGCTYCDHIMQDGQLLGVALGMLGVSLSDGPELGFLSSPPLVEFTTYAAFTSAGRPDIVDTIP